MTCSGMQSAARGSHSIRFAQCSLYANFTTKTININGIYKGGYKIYFHELETWLHFELNSECGKITITIWPKETTACACRRFKLDFEVMEATQV
jgi:hypothetical protein